MRRIEPSDSSACERVTGFSVTRLTVPFTRGSTMKFLPVAWPTAFTTDSRSALTKLSETSSPVLPGLPFWEAGAVAGGAAKTGIEPATIVAQHARTMARTVSREEALCMVSFMVVGTLARAPA